MHDIQALRRVLEYKAERESPKEKDKGTNWPPDMERRELPRYDYSAEGTGTVTDRPSDVPLAAGPDFPVITLTLSGGGTSFLANYDLQPGDVVELTLPSADGGAKRLRARVVRSRRAGLNAFEIGTSFTHGA